MRSQINNTYEDDKLNEVYDSIIVGGGPTGMFTSFMNGMLGIKSVLIDSMDKLGGQCTYGYPEKPIFDIAGFPKIKAKDLISNLELQMSRFDPHIMLNTSISSIDIEQNTYSIHTNSGTIVSKTVIFASGEGRFKYNKPRLSNITQLEANGYIRYSMNDLELFRNKVVVVGGGGDSAVDWCLTLHGIASKIYLVHRKNTLRAMEALQNELFETLDADNIILETDISSIGEVEGAIRIKLVSNCITYELDADYFIPCYGVQGDKSFLDQLELNLDNTYRIIVDPTTCQSSKPRIYAVGDANSYPNKRKLITCGFGEAVNASYHIREIIKGDFTFEYSTSRFS